MSQQTQTAFQMRQWIDAVLANDEASTDEELVAYFMQEAPMSEQAARNLVATRADYLRGER